MKRLESLGYNEWFREHADPDQVCVHEVARVVSVRKDSYVVSKGDGGIFAECSGSLLFTATSPVDLPTTGDWVYVDFYDDDSHAIIHGVVPRKTFLKRKTVGKVVDFQLVAANIDVAFIIQSLDNNLNFRRLERYLVMVNESRITPFILLSKSDLKTREEIEDIEDNVKKNSPGAAVLFYSSLSGENITAIKRCLLPGLTYCLLGSSGVGKTTLLNTLLGNVVFETQAVSRKENKGRHTTTSRELVQLENGSLLLDTPGMRELGNMSVDIGIDETFSDIIALSRQCRFVDCTHAGENGCAVLAAIEDGYLTERRYRNYVKMKNESAFHEMSYSEKRKKDKDFGKMIKSVKKKKSRR